MSETPFQAPPQKIQNLSFQLILINFTASKGIIEQGGSLKLSIIRGKQVFEQTKNIPISASQGVIALNRARLNFMVFSYDPAKVFQFGLKIQHSLMGEEKCIGECIIDCNSYAQIFLSNGNGAFQETLYLNPQEKIDVELYVEKNRFSLQKLVRQITSPRTKSALMDAVPVYQRITDKKFQFRQQLSLSPHRSRQNPYKRNSPRKNRDEMVVTPKKRQQFVKAPEIHIQTHYFVVSNKQAATQQPVVEKTEQSQPEQIVQVAKTEPISKQIISKPQTTHEQVTVPLQQLPVVVQVTAAASSEEMPQKIEQIPLKIEEPQIFAQQNVVVAQQVTIQPKAVVLQQVQTPKAEFKLQNAADLLKQQSVSPPEEKHQQKPINNTLEETGKPTLHTIIEETPQIYQMQQLKQTKVSLKGSIQTPKLQGFKEDVTQIIKRVSIFKTMPLKLKIFLAFVLLVFLMASNYVEEQDPIETISEIEAPTINQDLITTTNQTIQEKIPKKSKMKKNARQQIKTQKNPAPKTIKQKAETKSSTKQKTTNHRQKRKEK